MTAEESYCYGRFLQEKLQGAKETLEDVLFSFKEGERNWSGRGGWVPCLENVISGVDALLESARNATEESAQEALS